MKQKTVRGLLVSFFVLVQAGVVTAEPQTQQPGLLVPDSAIPLSQTNFADGPVRITQPGYYYFTENVTFDPSPAGSEGGIDGGRIADRPRTGAWFTALSIECDNVIIDLNTKTFECSQSFIDNHEFKVFSMIELNNSPFQHLIFAYSDATGLIAAHNVTIKNGTLGRSTHHSIHGNLNDGIYIYDVVCRDWEVAGIALNGLTSGEIKNVTITGVEHSIKFTGLLAEINSARGELEKLVYEGDVQAQSYLDALNTFKDQILYEGHPSGTHDGNCYGLFINRTVDVGPVVTQHCTDGTANCITLENITVCNINASLIETVAIANLYNERLKGEPFGVLRWFDAYAGSGNSFAPNALLKAQVYVVNTIEPTRYPDGFAANILSETPNESVFLSQVKPIFEGDFAGHTLKGVFGIRVDCGHDIRMHNCRVMALHNESELGKSLDDIPGGSSYDFDIERYHANDVFGISLAACRNCVLTDCTAYECHSENGNVHGISVRNESEAITCINCVSADHYAERAEVGSSINPPSTVYGFYIQDSVKNNYFKNCVANSLQAPRAVYGFSIAYAADTVCEGCEAASNRTTDSSNLDQVKYTIGFRSLSSDCTVFDGCTVSALASEGESNAVAASSSQTYGFLLEGDGTIVDKRAVIEHCVARCINVGSGRGAGIQIAQAQQAKIVGNELATCFGQTAYGLSYGFHDMNGNLLSMVLKNIAYNNGTKNFFSSYAEGELPLVTALYTNIANLHFTNEWNNICIEPAPGVQFSDSNSNTTLMIRQVIRN